MCGDGTTRPSGIPPRNATGEMAKSLFYDFSEKSHAKKKGNVYEPDPDTN
jgi:hypothetical protein